MWSDIYQFWASGLLDRNPNPNPNPNPKEGEIEMFWLEFVFESYFEVDNIFFCRWQAGSKISSYVES